MPDFEGIRKSENGAELCGTGQGRLVESLCAAAIFFFDNKHFTGKLWVTHGHGNVA